ncbi:MAG: hypothetical protein IKR52_01815 [Paludibacteraceae bacterium]|nr:hypothetical protein [Paludibacteraceae bacterium]
MVFQTLSVYFIKNTDDWNTFAAAVNEGDTYADKLVILGADISVSQKIGDSDKNTFFSGTFDGNRHTITAQIEEPNKPGTALFHKIQGATIKELTVAGVINGGIHAAGVVGYAENIGNKIEKCIVTANVSGSTHIGGILGHGLSSNVVIDNCVFKGKLVGGSTAKGVFFGWGDEGGLKSVKGCLYILQENQNTQNLDLVKMCAGDVSVKESYKTEDIGTYGKRAYLTKPKDVLSIKKTALDGTEFYVTGDSSSENPLMINNEADWNALANAVSKGNPYTGEFIKLNSDISVSQKVGRRQDQNVNWPFCGNFDGNGHTITATIQDEISKTSPQEHCTYTALFQIIDGATIKNLIVAGTITGGQYTAGLVGISMGTNNRIKNCVVTAIVSIDESYISSSDESYIGGFLGYGDDSDITIDNCVFKGLLKGKQTIQGVFIGLGDGNGTQKVSNSLYILPEGQDTEHLFLAQNVGRVDVTDCYKTADIGTFGIRAYIEKPSDYSSIEKTAVDGTKFYVIALPSGSGTEDDPYIISNDKEWNNFAESVSKGKTYAGEFIKLNANINVSRSIGEKPWWTKDGNGEYIIADKCFSGTFDGNGHTITASINETLNAGATLFCTINSAVIKNLTVAGTFAVLTYDGHAGVVGYSIGSGNTIERCIVTAIIDGDSDVGGVLHNAMEGDISIDKCVFKGVLKGGSKGAFVGSCDDGVTLRVSNSLYILQNGQDLNNLDLVQYSESNVNVTECYKTADIGTFGIQVCLTRPFDFDTIEKTAVDGTKFYVRTLPPGCGTKDNPYIIKKQNDWNIFAESVSKGNSYAGEFIKLNANISVSQMVGKWKSEIEYSPFSGTFDGGDYTITATIKNNEIGTALFSVIQNVTIKNLTVAGKITGDMHAAGLVGGSLGSGNKILNCIVTATIKGKKYIGGILGHGLSSNIVIDNCVFKGKLDGESTAKGVFFGWGDEGGLKSVKSCLYILQENQNTQNLDLVKMCAGDVSVKESYKTENIGKYGALAYLTEPPDFSTIEKTAIDGTKFYVLGLPSGSGTEADPYIINNENDWNSFAKLVSGNDGNFLNNYDDDMYIINRGKNYEGEYIKLNADITVSEKIGDFNREKFFAGIFDGNGHTITAKIEDPNTRAMAVFSYIKGAIVKNLTVAGSITGERHSAGVVGRSMGSGNKILNCIVTATIKGDPYIGGILGHGKDSETTIDNCVFKGKFLGGSDIIGVFVGYSDDGTKTVTNSLYIKQNDPNSKCLDLANKNTGNISVTDCYKTENIGTYGTLAYLTKPSSGSYIEKTAVDGTKFYIQA